MSSAGSATTAGHGDGGTGTDVRARGVLVGVFGVLALCGTLFGWLCRPAGAHTGDESYLYLDITEDALGGRIEFPFADVRTVFGLSLSGSSESIEAEVASNEERLQRYAADHIELGAAGRTWPLEFETVTLLESENDWGDYVVLPFVADLGGAAPPRNLDVRFDPFVDEIDGRDAMLLIGNDWNGGVIDNGDDVLVGFDAGTRSRTIDLQDQSWWKNLSASVEAGLDHIRTGPDHILFVLVLLLPAVLIYVTAHGSERAGGTWVPGRSFGGGLWRILKIATMFTLAHTITFTLAGLDLIPLPPSKLVESVIAASIAAAALHNLWPIAPNREWLMAFGFGLFHGLGFASLVSTLDVSRSTQLVSLLGRNVGIEIGQAIVILMVFPALHLARRLRAYRPAFTVISIGLALVALGWFVERLFEVDLGISGYVDKIVAFPRSLGLAGLATAAVALLYWRERRAGRLLPVHVEAPASSASPSLAPHAVG
jgi:hypothetical protein